MDTDEVNEQLAKLSAAVGLSLEQFSKSMNEWAVSLQPFQRQILNGFAGLDLDEDDRIGTVEDALGGYRACRLCGGTIELGACTMCGVPEE